MRVVLRPSKIIPFALGLVVLGLGLGFGQGAASAGPASIMSFHPTQMEIGRKAAEFHITQWKTDAKKSGMSLKEYAQKVLQPKFAAQKIPTVIDPDGALRNTDAHHRITALRKLTRMTGVSFEVDAQILADYRGRTFEEYANHFITKLGKGQFTPKIEQLPPVERMKFLPKTYADLHNNPMRSALEVVFNTNGIQGSLMRDYIEFRVAEKLLGEGLLDDLKEKHIIAPGARVLPAQLATDERVVKIIANRVAKKGMRHYLLSEAKDDASREQLKDLLQKMRD